VHGLSDAELAELARMSARGCAAPADVRASLLAGADGWLSAAAGPDQAAGQRSICDGTACTPPFQSSASSFIQD
jgi:hypothetical protein